MPAMVGAFIEEEPVRRVVRPVDALALLVLIGLAAILHTVIVARTAVTARDSMRFARAALNLESPNAAFSDGTTRTAIDVLRDPIEFPDPPGYPLAVLAVSKVVRVVIDRPLAEQMMLSTQIVSAIAGTMLVVPMYFLGRMLFASPFVGFAAALLFQSLPVAAQTLSDGLSDALSLLAMATSLLFGVRAVRRRSMLNSLLAGITTGCAYLVRPEGLIVMLGIAAVIAGLAILKLWPRGAAVARLVALTIGAILPAAPYMVVINGISNKPTVNDTINKLVPWRMHAAAPTPGLLADWYSGHGSQSLWVMKAITTETIKTCHYGVLAFAVIGVVVLRRRIAADPGIAVVLAVAGLHTLLLITLGMKPMPADLGSNPHAVPPYISERHTLLLAMIACVFAAASLPVLSRMRFGEWIMLAVLVAAGLPVAVKPLHANRVGHVHAGQFLGGVAAASDAVIDPFGWAEWFAGRRYYSTVAADPPPEILTARWVIWEPTAGTKSNPHSRLPRLAAAHAVLQDTANPAVLMYHWPEHVSPEDAKVVVYRQAVIAVNKKP
jgi:hypothetical protein